MSERLQIETKSAGRRGSSFAPSRPEFLQRKCACGGPSGLDGACAECRNDQFTAPRRSADQAEPSNGTQASDDAMVQSPDKASPTVNSAAAPVAETAAPTKPSSGPLIVENDALEVGPGQMRKNEFLDQMEREVCASADAELAAAGRTSQGCPYIKTWLGFYRGRSSQHVERALRKYAPEAAGVSTARDYIPIVSQRVRRAAAAWVATGQITGLPEELAGMLPGAGLLGAVGGFLAGAASAVAGVFGGIGRAIGGIGRAIGGLFAKAR